MVQTLETARSTLRFTGFIAINNLLYFNLLFASLFQMIYFSFKTTTSTIDFITALLTFVCLSYLFYLMFIKLQNPNGLFCEENFKKKYGHFYADLKLISFLTRNFKFFLLGQKLLVTFFSYCIAEQSESKSYYFLFYEDLAFDSIYI